MLGSLHLCRINVAGANRDRDISLLGLGLLLCVRMQRLFLVVLALINDLSAVRLTVPLSLPCPARHIGVKDNQTLSPKSTIPASNEGAELCPQASECTQGGGSEL